MGRAPLVRWKGSNTLDGESRHGFDTSCVRIKCGPRVATRGNRIYVRTHAQAPPLATTYVGHSDGTLLVNSGLRKRQGDNERVTSVRLPTSVRITRFLPGNDKAAPVAIQTASC